MNPEQNKLLVRRLIDAVNHNNLDALGDIAGGEIAEAAGVDRAIPGLVS